MSGVPVYSGLPLGWETWPPHRKEQLRQTMRLRRFQRIYRDDPIAFAHDCIDWDRVPRPATAPPGLAPYQEEIISNLYEYGREAAKGPHGIGKTGITAIVVHHFGLSRDGEDWKAPLTSSKWRQLKEFLWPEIHKWARYLRWDVIGRDPYEEPVELQDMALRLGTGSAFAVASNEPTAIEGAHADCLLYVYDEAKSIQDETFDASEGAFAGAGPDTGREAYGLTLSTPGSPAGRFYNIHRKDPRYLDWHTTSVTLEQAIAAGRISQKWAEEKAAQWGTDSPIYKNRVLGVFAAGDEGSVIPLEWVEAAQERWRDLAVLDIETKQYRIEPETLPGFTNVGADIADEGEDRTVLALRFGMVIYELRDYPLSPDTMETTGNIMGVLRKYGGYAVVDAIGMGGPVVSRLREQDLNGEHVEVVGFIASGHSNAVDESGEQEFQNLRAEAWWSLREKLNPANHPTLALPPHDQLVGDLTAPRMKTTSGGKLIVESKEDVRKRLKRSTDYADAVVMAMWARRPRTVSQSAADFRIPGV